MHIVLDTNIFIFGLTMPDAHPAEQILNIVAERSPKITVSIPRTIFNETRKNLTTLFFKEFITLTANVIKVHEDEIVPFSIGYKYELFGLKPADAFIAAYTEWIKAELLVSENRHFLPRQSGLSFKVVTAEQALKILT